MNFVGDRKGEFTQELSYTWVGEGNGEFELLAPAPATKRPSYMGCFCLLGSLLVFAIIVAVNVMSERQQGSPDEQPEDLPRPGGARSAVRGAAHGAAHGAAPADGGGAAPKHDDRDSCDVTELRRGELVQAAFDIAFRPAGFVTEGSIGRVAAVLPSDDQWVFIDWQGTEQLHGSKVSRSQLVKALRPGDSVQAVAEIKIRPPQSRDDDGPFDMDDLVAVSTDLPSGVPAGTAGYVSKVLPGQRYAVDFPTYPQFAGTEVSGETAFKAPHVADEVVAVRDIRLGATVAVPQGTQGVVTALKPDRGTYMYTVAWNGKPLAASVLVGALSLRVASESSAPAPVRLPAGTRGSVTVVHATRGLSDGKLTVSWHSGGHFYISNVSRGEVDKAPAWSAEHIAFCCKTKKVACGVKATKLAGEPFACDENEQVWHAEETDWCCENRGLHCDQADKNVVPGRRIFNCSTHEAWPQAKRHWCCAREGLGCKGGR